MGDDAAEAAVGAALDPPGEPAETTGTAGGSWASVPPMPPPRSFRRQLTWIVPVLVVAVPVVAMRRHGISLRRTEGAAVAGLLGAYAIGWCARAKLPLEVTAAAAAAGVGVGVAANWTFAAWVAAALLVVGLALVREGPVLVVMSIAKIVGRVVRVLLFVPLGVVIVVIPWLVNTIARVDPLRSPARPDSSWLARRRRDIRPAQLWAGDPLAQHVPLGQRIRATVVWPVVIVLAVFLIRLPESKPGTTFAGIPVTPRSLGHFADIVGGGGGGNEPVPNAFRTSPWYQEYITDIAWAEDPRTAWQPLNTHRIGDVRTHYVNVVNGVRLGWHPPPCSCRRLKVWVYGGSTTFGLGQRDDYTIPSDLARAAWEHGIALDVDNRGVVGDVHWQEANRYAWDLATYGPPDLVIFYDGINDVTATQTLVNEHVGDVYAAVDFQNDDLWKRYLEQVDPPAPPSVPGASVPHPPKVVTDTPAQFVTLLMKRYNRSRVVSRDVSAVHHVPTYYVWQPSRLSRPQVIGEPRDDKGGPDGRAREAAIRRHVPRGVINLMGVYDQNHDILFYDLQHTNEEGSALVAEALYGRLAADLRAIEAGRTVAAAP